MSSASLIGTIGIMFLEVFGRGVRTDIQTSFLNLGLSRLRRHAIKRYKEFWFGQRRAHSKVALRALCFNVLMFSSLCKDFSEAGFSAPV